MNYGCFGAALEVKFSDSAAQQGSFEGYGAVFGIKDSHKDVIEPGAFAKSLLDRQREGRPLPTMLKMHGAMSGNAHEPIGVWESMAEDPNGLHVKGRLIGLDTERGKWNYAQLKEGALKGLSIGYSMPPGGYSRGKGGPNDPLRHLKALNLREVSLVDEPSNAYAQVYSMKSMAREDNVAVDEIKTIRDFENFLRDVGGFSNTAAKAIAAGGFKQRPDPRDEDGIGDYITGRFDALINLIKK